MSASATQGGRNENCHRRNRTTLAMDVDSEIERRTVVNSRQYIILQVAANTLVLLARPNAVLCN